MRLQAKIPDELMAEIDLVCQKRFITRTQFFIESARWNLLWGDKMPTTPPSLPKSEVKTASNPLPEKNIKKSATELDPLVAAQREISNIQKRRQAVEGIEYCPHNSPYGEDGFSICKFKCKKGKA